ncbi:mRNA (guanine-N(7))-methyltransferase domain-containing protein [Artemisia annua]|uniref:mRNA (guanine-N(7))-methyltransferase n=1 Tax=Artemisia annua TaxID=35608 RepID=A0A2U1L1C6_ARTAN|nr:mRNA (guanine-N(7))-methyltransferase domain-containing protein [Artemisia annua]
MRRDGMMLKLDISLELTLWHEVGVVVALYAWLVGWRHGYRLPANDEVSSGVSEVREAWESQRKIYTSEFYELDPCIDNLEANLGDKGNTADIVCCMQRLQFCFETEEKVQRLLHNVSALLKPGGFLIGITLDSSTIWAKYQKNVEAYHNRSGGMKPNLVPNCIRSENYMITFEVEEEKFPFFGKKYQFKFANDASAETHCLSHEL